MAYKLIRPVVIVLLLAHAGCQGGSPAKAGDGPAQGHDAGVADGAIDTPDAVTVPNEPGPSVPDGSLAEEPAGSFHSTASGCVGSRCVEGGAFRSSAPGCVGERCVTGGFGR